MNPNTIAVSLGAALLCVAGGSAAQIEEVIVTAEQVKHVYQLQEDQLVLIDTAELLKRVPGGNVNANGPLSGIPQYRGLFGPRIGVTVNGARIASAGPNWMDPPLSYAAPAQLVEVEVFRGIAPISVAQESLGGAIRSRTLNTEFAGASNYTSSGRLSLSGQSANNAALVSGQVSLANADNRFSLSVMSEQGDDAEFSDGTLPPTEFDRQRAELSFGRSFGDHTVNLSYARNETGIAGTPALPMDIDYFDGDLFNLEYEYAGNSWALEAQVFGSELAHGMTNFHLRSAPMNRAMWRQNTTSADNVGFKAQAQKTDNSGSWLAGLDYFSEAHDSLIDNPNNAQFFVQNFNDAKREVTGVFIERQSKHSDQLQSELGLRVNYVRSSAGQVNGSPAMMMPPAQVLRDQFNAADRSNSDTNIDVVAKLWFRQSSTLSWYAGVGHKTRSPAYLERFLWLPLQSTGGLADGLTYTGNLDLKPEKSTELEAGFDWHGNAFYISPRVFVRDIDDYIQGTTLNNPTAAMFVTMMNQMMGTNNPAPLQFNNVDARLSGMDMQWHWELANKWSLEGRLSYVRGKRQDIDDNLYRIAPLNSAVQLNFADAGWGGNLEWVRYDEQDKVSSTNAEQVTDGYSLFNLNAWVQVAEPFRIALGVHNVANKYYENHLTGYNRAANTDVPLGSRLPELGRNFYLRADYRW